MLIEAAQLRLVGPMCARIASSSAPATLLSLPYPYPNYFCAIAPWHGYVQTWYDTSSAQTIGRLVGELETAPPSWIVYQHDLSVMEVHEKRFTGGRRLPQRALDDLIASRVSGGAWTIVERVCLDGSDWMLVRTAAAAADSEGGTHTWPARGCTADGG